jgi:metal-dependent amidase/aminoacylase/carboxypeptidase family protein
VNTARAAGIEENLLPEVKSVDAPALPTLNDAALSQRLHKVWGDKFGSTIFASNYKRSSMVAEDFANFTAAPFIPSVYFKIGGTPAAALAAAKQGGPAVASNHSPLFKIAPEPAIRTGVEVTVVALLDLMKK